MDTEAETLPAWQWSGWVRSMLMQWVGSSLAVNSPAWADGIHAIIIS